MRMICPSLYEKKLGLGSTDLLSIETAATPYRSIALSQTSISPT